VLWAKSYGGPSIDQGLAVVVDGSGNAYFTDRFQGTASFGGVSLTNACGFDVFVAKGVGVPCAAESLGPE
jgi:hypothetical protein